MAWAERYPKARVGNLKDDEHHMNANVLASSALADKYSRDIGGLLHAVKYGGTMFRKLAKALYEQGRMEKLMAEAEKRGDKAKADELRRELDANLCACTVTGGDADDFRGLYRKWQIIVENKGSARKWVKSEDISIAPILYRRVADASLAYYLDSTCKTCNGTGTQGAAGCYKTCLTCKGFKRAELPAMRAYEKHRVLEMVDELTALEHTHAGVATVKLRREA